MYLIFDLDGTLVDSASDILRCLRIALLEARIPVARELDRSLIGPPLRDIVRAIAPGASEGARQRTVLAFRQAYDRSGYSGTRPYPGVPETLAALAKRGARMAVATNKARQATLAILEQLSLLQFFDNVGCVGEPSATDKQALLARLLVGSGLPAKCVWMIGDARDDILAGRSNGMITVAHLGGYEARETLLAANPDHAIERIEHLMRIVPGNVATCRNRQRERTHSSSRSNSGDSRDER